MAYTLEEIVARRRQLADDFAAEQKAVAEKFKTKIDSLDKWLQRYLIDNKLKTVSTESGTVMTYKRRNVKLQNLQELEAWVEFNGKPEFIKQSVDSTEVLAYLDAAEGRLLPDGLVMDSTDVLSIKAPK